MSSDIYESPNTDDDRRREIRVAAHELRTPLIAILGFAQVLLEEGARLDPAERDVMLASIVANAKAEEAVIQRWLEDRYPETGNGYHKSRVRSALVLEDEMTELMSDVAPQLGGDRVHLAIPGSLSVVAEKGALREIMTNLLTNATKYSPPDSPINVTTAVDDEDVTITVHNLGMIPAAQIPLIFDDGYRTPGNGQDGHGLGLAIVRQLVTGLGGRVWAESRDGATNFNFTLSRPTLASVYPFVPLR